MEHWIEKELQGSNFCDKRIQKRLFIVGKALLEHTGSTIPEACGSWANTKGAYRIYDNYKVTPDGILRGHYESTAVRVAAEPGFILCVQDTSELDFYRKNPNLVGLTNQDPNNAKEGKETFHCGTLMHSTFTMTTKGQPLGLAKATFWSRDQFRSSESCGNTVDYSKIPPHEKESYKWSEHVSATCENLKIPDRCVHLCDREGDVFGLFDHTKNMGTHFLIRSQHDREIEGVNNRLHKALEIEKPAGNYIFEREDRKGYIQKLKIQIKFTKVTLLPPDNQKNKFKPIEVTAILAEEIKKSNDTAEEGLKWILLTSLDVNNLKEAIEKVKWYSLRWRIEVFHKVLKSGCKVEDTLLRSFERINNHLALCCVIAFRTYQLTVLNREAPSTKPEVVFSKLELKVIDQTVKDLPANVTKKKDLNFYLVKVARLGGYLARRSDRPPGNIVIWRGLARLGNIMQGVRLGMSLGKVK